MEQLPQYEIDITLQEIEDGDGYLEYHECGYPIFWAYSIIPDNGEFEQEWFEPVDIVRGSSNLWDSIEFCPYCGEKLELRISGDYFDFDEIKQDISELVEKYFLEGDSIEFKILLEKVGMKLGVI